MQTLDLIIIFGYLIGVTALGALFAKKTGNDRRLSYESRKTVFFRGQSKIQLM